MTDSERLALADFHMHTALVHLTHAICSLGLSEGKAAVQVAHGAVTAAKQAVRHANEPKATKHVPSRPAPRMPDPEGDWWCGQCGAVVAGKMGACPKCGPVIDENRNVEMPF